MLSKKERERIRAGIANLPDEVQGNEMFRDFRACLDDLDDLHKKLDDCIVKSLDRSYEIERLKAEVLATKEEFRALEDLTSEVQVKFNDPTRT